MHLHTVYCILHCTLYIAYCSRSQHTVNSTRYVACLNVSCAIGILWSNADKTQRAQSLTIVLATQCRFQHNEVSAQRGFNEYQYQQGRNWSPCLQTVWQPHNVCCNFIASCTLYCIQALPRGGMYREIHSPRPVRFLEGRDFAPRGQSQGNLENKLAGKGSGLEGNIGQYSP